MGDIDELVAGVMGNEESKQLLIKIVEEIRDIRSNCKEKCTKCAIGEHLEAGSCTIENFIHVVADNGYCLGALRRNNRVVIEDIDELKGTLYDFRESMCDSNYDAPDPETMDEELAEIGHPGCVECPMCAIVDDSCEVYNLLHYYVNEIFKEVNVTIGNDARPG